MKLYVNKVTFTTEGGAMVFKNETPGSWIYCTDINGKYVNGQVYTEFAKTTFTPKNFKNKGSHFCVIDDNSQIVAIGSASQMKLLAVASAEDNFNINDFINSEAYKKAA